MERLNSKAKRGQAKRQAAITLGFRFPIDVAPRLLLFLGTGQRLV
jgi:hypothetical protein